MNLKKVTIPTLIVANNDDECHVTPPKGAQKIADLLMNVPLKEIKLFSGGDTPISKPCNGLSYHGFLGIETQVINYISDFIKTN